MGHLQNGLRIYRNPAESFYNSSNCEAIESEMLDSTPRVARLADFILRQSGNTYYSYNDLYVNMDELPISTGTCMPFFKKMFVTVNGKILPCERISQQFAVGQVGEDRVELNEEYVVAKHNDYLSGFVSQCVNCASNRFCKKCVYQIDNTNKEEARCPSFLTEKELEKKNEDIFKFLQEHPHYYRRILDEVKIER